MKKKVIIAVLCVAILAVLFLLISKWNNGRNVRLYDDLDASELSKIVIYYPGGTENVFTEEEDMNKFIAFLQSMHLSKGTLDDKDGSLFTAFLYYRDGSIEDIVLLGADLFAAGDEFYKTDRDYCDDFKAMWKELKKD